MVTATLDSERPTSPPRLRGESPSGRPTPVEPARPFLKWVGGKTQLLPQLLAAAPARFGTYHEPFLGGGAYYFAMVRERFLHRAVLSDVNPELIATYQTLQKTPERVIQHLRTHPHEPETFYRVRALDPSQLSPPARAARMIYLNRSCFNGLYRVNRRGEFNVPFGRYKNPTICDEGNLRAVSHALAPATIVESSFRGVLDRAERGDFVYFDPPYVPVSATANFTSYAKDGFGPEEQEELATAFETLARRGVRCLLSNSDAPSVRRRFRAFKTLSVTARRNVNCRAESRGPVGEVLVMSYDP